MKKIKKVPMCIHKVMHIGAYILRFIWFYEK